MKTKKQNIDYRITKAETDIIKCIAIGATLCHHLFLNHREYGQLPFRFALIGKICVSLFVFLSGYGMAIKFQKIWDVDSIKDKLTYTMKFFIGRLTKFYLNYWAIFIIFVPLGIFVFNRHLSDAYGTEQLIWVCLIKDLLGLQGVESYNATWWFNRLIISLWIFFPILYWLMKSRVISPWLLVLLYFNPGYYLNFLKFFAPGLPTYSVPFALGILVAIRGNEINKFLNKFNPYTIISLAIPITFLFLYMRNIAVTPYFIGIKVDPFAVISISLSVICVRRITGINFSAMAYVGTHSANMYLQHTFILGYFFPTLIYGIKNSLLIFVTLFSTSLFLSVVTESLKRRIGFYKLLDKIEQFLRK